MHIHSTNPYSKLLRVSYRSGGTVKKRTLMSLAGWSDERLKKLAEALAKRRLVNDQAERQELDQLILNLFAQHGWVHPSQAFQLLTWLQNNGRKN